MAYNYDPSVEEHPEFFDPIEPDEPITCGFCGLGYYCLGTNGDLIHCRRFDIFKLAEESCPHGVDEEEYQL